MRTLRVRSWSRSFNEPLVPCFVSTASTGFRSSNPNIALNGEIPMTPVRLRVVEKKKTRPEAKD